MKINVLGFTYNVERGYVQGKCEGSTDHIKQIIMLDENMDYDNSVETLLHEILHCIEYAMDMDVDEKIIGRLSRGLYSVIEDPQNEAFWAALAGSDDIMEEEDVACDSVEVLEGTCPGCNCSWSLCNCGDNAPSAKCEREYCRAFNEQVGTLSDADCWPRWDAPEAESSRKGFEDACRQAKVPFGSPVVTTTGDDLSGPYTGDPVVNNW